MAYAQRNSRPITAAQIKRIHTIIHIIGISDENYRAALESRFGVTTCKNLTLLQAKSFLDELEKLALKTDRERNQAKRQKAAEEFEGKQPKKFDDLDNRAGMASGAQLRKIEAQWQDISIVPDADARGRALRRFIQRITGCMGLRFLTAEDAGKVLNALKAMAQRETVKNKTSKKSA